MERGIELRRPWGSRTSTLVCTHGHATEVPTNAAPSTCPVCDAQPSEHSYTEGCDCAACTDCRAILDAHINDALDADDAELSCAEADAPRVLHVLPTPRAHQPSCTTPQNPLGWCDCTLPSEPPASHLGLLRDPETPATPEERATLARIRGRLIERIDSGARIDPEEPRS